MMFPLPPIIAALKQRQDDAKAKELCGDVSPDGKHDCVFGKGHEVQYHSSYPLRWWGGKWLRSDDGLTPG